MNSDHYNNLHHKLKQRFSIFVAVFCAVILTLTFLRAKKLEMHCAMPEAIGRQVDSLAIAISDLKYGLKGYLAYGSVSATLRDNGMTNDQKRWNAFGIDPNKEVLSGCAPLTKAIAIASTLKDPGSDTESLDREDKGLSDFYKYSLAIFGYRIEAFFYFYFVLIGLTILAYFVTFIHSPRKLGPLVVFSAVHFIAVTRAPDVGIQLFTVHNARFLALLAVLPALHLGLLSDGFHVTSKRNIFLALVQASIFVFAIHCRSSAAVLLIAPIAIGFFFASKQWPTLLRVNSAERSIAIRHVLIRFFWPAAILLLVFVSFQFKVRQTMDARYTKEARGHLFWHPMFVSLGAHPLAQQRYKIALENDACAFDYFYSTPIGQPFRGRPIDLKLYESVLKEKYFDIAKHDTKFWLETHFYYKPKLLIQSYLDSPFSLLRQSLTTWLLLVVTLSISFWGLLRFGTHSRPLLPIVAFWAGTSCLVPLVFFSGIYAMADTIACLNVLILYSASYFAYFIYRRIRRT